MFKIIQQFYNLGQLWPEPEKFVDKNAIKLTFSPLQGIHFQWGILWGFLPYFQGILENNF